MTDSSLAADAPNATPEALPVSGRRTRLAGLFIVLVAFGGFGAWAGLANLSVAVIASGTVSVDSFKKTIQHLEGGIVSAIHVDDGDHVTRGETLITLDNTESQSRLAIERTTFFTARAQETRLIAEQEGADQLEFPTLLTRMAKDHVRLEQVLSVQQKLFTSRRQSLQGEISAFNEQIQQYREQIEGLKQMAAINRRRTTSLSEEADDYRSLFKEGLGNNQRIRELDQQILQLQADSAQARAEMARLGSRISENRARIETRRQEYQKEVGEQLREAQSRSADARQRMIALEDQVQRTDIRAPVSGTVVGLELRTLGAVIKPGQSVMSIVPDTEGFFIDARVPIQDIDNVYAGQQADIRFSAFNQRRVPIIDGEVDLVSADSFADEATGARYYRARIRVSTKGQSQMTETMQLLSGMPAEVMIKTGQKTLFEYLSQPVTDMLNRAVRQD